MGWLANKVLKWSAQRQEAELREFLAKVSAADSSELGLTILLTTVCRHMIKRNNGLDFLHPAVVVMEDRHICWRLAKEAQACQATKDFPQAAAIMIWLHTLRSVMHLQLRPLGRELWAELSRGFPFAMDAVGLLTCSPDDLEGYDCIPEGLGART
jgi:hypothetical protein